MTTIRQRLWLVSAALLPACASAGTAGVCKRDPATYRMECQSGFSGLGGAAVTLPLAAVVYAIEGCTINGCELPNRCNPQTKRCEPIPCSETSSCPTGYHCRLDTKQCR